MEFEFASGLTEYVDMVSKKKPNVQGYNVHGPGIWVVVLGYGHKYWLYSENIVFL